MHNQKFYSLLLTSMFLCVMSGLNAELLHRYSFTDGDTVAVDSIGGQDGILENGASISGNAVQLDGSNQYVDLPADVIAGFSSLTLEAWFNFSTNGNWTRLFDFGNINGSVGEDYLFFTPQSGGGDTRLVIADVRSEQIVTIPTLSPDQPLHVACIYNDDDSTMSIYLNGSLANSISVSIPLSTVANVYNFLGRSLYSADPYLKGSIDEFRIYNHALSSEEISYNNAAGPDLLDYEHTASNPNPEKNAISVNSAAGLSWSAPTETPDSYTVYVSEFSDFSITQVINVTGTSCYPDLESQTTYYWRVDTNYGQTTYTGIVWNFTTCTSAVESIPPGDWNGDYEVSFTDLIMLAESWLNQADLFSYAEVSENWLTKESPLIINEFMADNDEYLTDPDGLPEEYDDWIEIYNRSSVSRDLGGMFLTDDLDIPTQWRIPDGVTVGPYEYIIFWADQQPEQGNTHTNFKLGADGEEIGLFDTDGVTLLDSVNYDQQIQNMSYGRYPDNASLWNLFAVPTPGACNCEGYDGIIEDVEFSADGGIFSNSSEAFDVYLTCDTQDVVIRYTTDFTEPTEASPEYTGPIHIDSTTCIRAKAFKPGWYSPGIVSRSYIFLDDVMTQSTSPAGFPSGAADYEVDPDVVNDPAYSATFKDDLRAVPSVCIVTPNDSLFGSTGIYTNYNSRGDAWERVASIEVIDPDPNLYYQADAGIRIHGGVGRQAAKKSFRLIFRGQYGPSKMEYPLFDDSDIDIFDQLVLRATWNYSWTGDSGGHTERAQYMRELYSHDTIRDMGGLQSYGRHVHVYVNGLYWGMYILVERPDDGFAAEHLGGSKSDYDVIKTDAAYWSGPQVIELVSGDRQAWDQLYALAAQDLSDPANYAEIQNYVDIPALIDYMLAIFHIGSRDAPTLLNTWTAPRNFYAIRKRLPGEGFVFLPWDCEWSLEDSNFDVVNRPYENGYENPAYLFKRLTANTEFRIQVADRIHQHYFNNGVLTEANTVARYWNRVMDIDRAIIGESARWGDTLRSTPYTRNIEWVNERNRLTNTYFPARDDVVLSQLRSAGYYPNIDAPIFNINGSYQHGGYITSSDLLSMSSTSPTIWYTTDGSDPRLPTTTQSTEITLVPEAADKRVLVPSEDIGTDWRTNPAFDDSGWELCTGVPGGVGFETSSGYEGLISLDMEDEMYGSGKNNSCYIRIPFTVTAQDLAAIDYMTLKIRYDDGYVAYLNGIEVDRINFTGTPEWDSNAATRTGDADTVGWDFEIDLSAHLNDLQVGDNILAIQAMNASETSSDFLMCSELVAGTGPGGGVSPTAIEYTAPFTLNQSTQINARVLDGSTWSALNEATYAVGPVAESLRVSELMYHPADPNDEFIELINTGTESINLNLVRLTKGVDFTFGPEVLAPDEYILLVRNQASFMNRYPAFTGRIAGQYDGALDDAGEKIRLRDAVDTIIQEFSYKDGWYDITDGDGFSLTIRDAYSPDPNTWDRKEGWRPSAVIGGSPGEDDAGLLPDPGSIVINEVLAHSHAMNPDWIELHNTTDTLINIGGWFLSDSNADDPNIMKYQIPLGTSIAANDYTVFYEDTSFGNPAAPGVNTPFALSEGGDSVYLRSGSGGVIGGYEDAESFGASATGIAFGRYIKSVLDGGVNFVPMSENTPGDENAYPKVGPVLISEIMYNPEAANTGGEYLELHNITDAPVTLEDAVSTETSPGVYTTETVQWQFSDGIDFVFPPGTTIPAKGYLIIAENPMAFTAYYGAMPSGVDVLGPFANDTHLSNGGEQVQMVRPGDLEYGSERYWIRTERVTYDDETPWPITPDGDGDALHQKTPDTAGANYGNDVINWMSGTPSPGS